MRSAGSLQARSRLLSSVQHLEPVRKVAGREGRSRGRVGRVVVEHARFRLSGGRGFGRVRQRDASDGPSIAAVACRPLCGRYPNGRTRPIPLANAELHDEGPTHPVCGIGFPPPQNPERAVAFGGGKLAVPRQPAGPSRELDAADRPITSLEAAAAGKGGTVRRPASPARWYAALRAPRLAETCIALASFPCCPPPFDRRTRRNPWRVGWEPRVLPYPIRRLGGTGRLGQRE